MTDAYHKARRLFALFSGILLAWEYVGVRIARSAPSNDDAGTDATLKLPVVDTPVQFESPEVIPTLILVLVLYFAFRFGIEWSRCPESERQKRASFLDAVVAYVIGGAATVLFMVQQATEFRLASVFTPMTAVGGVAGLMLLLFLFVSSINLLASWTDIKLSRSWRMTLLGCSVVSAGLVFGIFWLWLQRVALTWGAIAAITVGSGVGWFLLRTYVPMMMRFEEHFTEMVRRVKEGSASRT
jgi:hypothetical protein